MKQQSAMIVNRNIVFVTHARFSSFFNLKRGPKVTFFTDRIKKYYICTRYSKIP